MRFKKGQYDVELVAERLNRYGELVIEGRIDGRPFIGKLAKVNGQPVIAFDLPVQLGRQRVGGISLPPAEAAELTELRDRLVREQQARAEQFAAATPPQVTIAIGGDTGRYYVWPEGIDWPDDLPEGTQNRLAAEIAARMEALGVHAERLFELGEPTRSAVGPVARRVVTQELLRALEQLEQQHKPRTQTATTADAHDHRPVVVLRRCWECGRISIRYVPPGIDRTAVETWVRRAVERGTPRDRLLASAGFDPDPADWATVIETFYCGC